MSSIPLPPLRLVVMGTGAFAVPMFRAVLASRHRVVGVVTRPAAPGPGKRPPPTSPVRREAESLGIEVFDPAKINTDAARAVLRSWEPELLVVADYGQILRPSTLALARLGGINLHGSLLPKYRGAAPVHWALYHGETETGVSVLHMTPEMDAGPCLAQRTAAIDPDETTVELEARLAELGAPLVCEVIDALQQGTAQPVPQDEALATYAPRLQKSDGQIDWQRTARQIKDHVRAMQPWPRTFTYWHRTGSEPVRLIVGRVAVRDTEAAAEPGTVVAAWGNQLHVAAKSGVVAIEQVQPAGKRMLASGEFLRGYPVRAGERFGPP
jgi:methionyl-tRNA formyltransferase